MNKRQIIDMITSKTYDSQLGIYYDPSSGELWRIKVAPIKIICSGWFSGKYRNHTTQAKIDGEAKKVTHIMYYIMTGAWPPLGMVIDHKDGDVTNNSWVNLRLATYSQNAVNAARPTRTLPIGVYQRKNKYLVVIQGLHIGTYDNLEEATNEARRVTEIFHGEFALNNRPKPFNRRGL